MTDIDLRLIEWGVKLYGYVLVTVWLARVVRADYHNPIVRVLLTVTEPIVRPIRRMIPLRMTVDVAGIAVYVLLVSVTLHAVANMADVEAPGHIVVVGAAAAHFVSTLCTVLTIAILVNVLSSWFPQAYHHPIGSLARQLGIPVLAPLQRVIPPLGPLDISPIVGLFSLSLLDGWVGEGLLHRLLADWSLTRALSVLL